MNKRNRFFRLFVIPLVCMLMFGNSAISVLAAERSTNAANQKSLMQITDIDQLRPFFPDENFRKIVFKALTQEGTEGTSAEDVLNNFRGEIEASGLNKSQSEKIFDAHGIEYLRNAQLVNLKYNEIRDFTFLEKPGTQGKTYYGDLLVADPDISLDERNVVWNFAGNPIEKLPSTFGGRLKILQPGSSSYNYPQDAVSGSFIYVRPTDGTLNEETVEIAKTKIYDNGVSKNSDIGTCTPYYSIPGDTNVGLNVVSYNDSTADLTGPQKSGTAHLSVGTSLDLNYQTLDDEGTIGPGAVSHPYYLTYTFRIYDKITASSANAGNAELTKTDKITGAPVSGAEYELYKKDGTLVAAYTTSADGKISAQGLLAGDYYFQEKTAPEGYHLNTDLIPFTIALSSTAAAPTTTVGGGEDSVTTTAGQTVTAAAGEKLFSGGKDKNGNLLSPSITLSSDKEQLVKLVQVTYSKLEVSGTVKTNVTRSFSSLAEAEADINSEKAYDIPGTNIHYGTNILGSVSVQAFYTNPAVQPVQLFTTDEALPTTAVTVYKNWIDKGDFTGPHDDITINLLRDGQPLTAHVLKNGETSYTFTNLTKETADGHIYTYTVTEDPVADYTSMVTGSMADGFTITNTFENTDAIQISGEKIWVDYNDGMKLRPDSITLSLYKTSDDKIPVSTSVVTPNQDGKWLYTFDDLPKYENDGTVITYKIKEDAAVQENYTAEVSADNSIITNTLKPEKASISISGKKVWDDFNNALNTRPDEVAISLLQNGTVCQTVTTDEKSGWIYSFKNLPKFSADGAAYVYTVKEPTVPKGYTAVVSKDGSTLTNTLDQSYNDIVSIQLEKKWTGEENASALPAGITVKLYSSEIPDKVIQEISISTKDSWKASIDNLPKYTADGKLIVYSLQEVAVSGYKLESQKAVVNAAGNTWTVVLTNAKVITTDPKDPQNPDVTNPKDPQNPNVTNPKLPIKPEENMPVKTGDKLPIPLYGLLTVSGLGTAFAVWTKRRKYNAN